MNSDINIGVFKIGDIDMVGNQGGKREGAGRPAFLKNAKKVLITLEAKHISLLDKIKNKKKLSGRSEAMRVLLDKYANS